MGIASAISADPTTADVNGRLMTNVRDLLIVTTTCRTDSPSLIHVAFDDWALARWGGTTIAVIAAAATQYVKIRRFSPRARHPSDNRPRKTLALVSNLCDIPTPIC